MPRRVSQQSPRRQEISLMDDDRQPMQAPVRSSAISTGRRKQGANNAELAPLHITSLYPTRSNLERHGVAVGSILQDEDIISEEEGDNFNVFPQELNLPNRPQLQRLQSEMSQVTMPYDLQSVEGPPRVLSLPPRYHSTFSQVTMPQDLESFDGTEFERVPPSDDYLDDEELDLYLRQLAREEDEKKQERESIKQMVSSQRESLQSILYAMDISDDDFILQAAANDEEYLERLLEEQIQVQQRYSMSPRRISQSS